MCLVGRLSLNQSINDTLRPISSHSQHCNCTPRCHKYRMSWSGVEWVTWDGGKVSRKWTCTEVQITRRNTRQDGVMSPPTTVVNAATAAICLWWRARLSHFALRGGRARGWWVVQRVAREWRIMSGVFPVDSESHASQLLRRYAVTWVSASDDLSHYLCASSCSSRDVTVCVPLRSVPLAPVTSLMRWCLVSVADILFPSGPTIRQTAWTVDMTIL